MVLVYSDNERLILEMLAKGKELAKALNKPLIAVAIGKDAEAQASRYIHYGADKVFVAGTEFENFKVEEYTEILVKVVREENPEIVLIGSNKNGKELAPRLASKLDTGCITDCTNIFLEDNSLIFERIVYSGNAIAVQKCRSSPAIVTIPPKAYDPLEKDEGRSGEVIKKTFDIPIAKSKILGIEAMKTEGVNVEDAEIIVSCGRGFKNKEDLKLAEDLAEALKGYVIGCSRPLAADLRWLSEDHWIGLSGHKVKPKLYIAAGISGQIQHIAGMRDSGIIVAINKDPEAPIFKSADYGIVGDLYEVLPKLTQAIKEKVN